MIAIIDYGAGNVFSLHSSLQMIGEDSVVTRDPEIIHACERIILPGVGAFGDAVDKLKETGLYDLVKKEASAGKPLLGICLGMQLLFEKSFEFGEHEGLGLLKGSVEAIAPRLPEKLDIPHMGWNQLHFNPERKKCPLFHDLKEGDYVYFVHSYAAFHCDESLAASTDYGIPLTAAVWKNNIYGTQFHPEKSGETGLKILKAFAAVPEGKESL